MEPTNTLMVPLMSVSGTRINSMEKVSRSGLMELSMKGSIWTVKSMEMVVSLSRMAAPTLANSKTTRYQVSANTYGQMENSMRVLGNRTRCTAKEYSSGEMVNDMKANLSTTREKELVPLNGKTVEYMMVNGRMANNMEKAYSQVKMAKLKKESGRMEKRSGG